MVNDTLEISGPAQEINVSTAYPSPPEIENQYRKTMPADLFRQQGIAPVVWVRRAAGGNTVADADHRIRPLIAWDKKPAVDSKILDFQRNIFFQHRAQTKKGS
jgi:hypothetical protein